jgi:glycosyltransferase involved in cell wall biosynthesis
VISVVIPTYNRVHVLGRAVESVLSQTYESYEIIVVDDGSTDSTKAMIKEKYGKVRFLSISHSGVSGARNRGIMAADGEWVAFLDSDDYWLPRKLERQMEFLRAFPQYMICHTNEIWIRNGVRINQGKKHQKSLGWFFKPSLHLCLISPSSVIIHKSVFETCGMFDEQLEFVEDYDLWLRITSRYPVGYVDERLVVKSGGHADQLSKKIEGIERYRIHALEKLISGGTVQGDFLHSALDVYQNKCRIYMNGCRKRGKQHEMQDLERRMENILTLAQSQRL